MEQKQTPAQLAKEYAAQHGFAIMAVGRRYRITAAQSADEVHGEVGGYPAALSLMQKRVALRASGEAINDVMNEPGIVREPGESDAELRERIKSDFRIALGDGSADWEDETIVAGPPGWSNKSDAEIAEDIASVFTGGGCPCAPNNSDGSNVKCPDESGKPACADEVNVMRRAVANFGKLADPLFEDFGPDAQARIRAQAAKLRTGRTYGAITIEPPSAFIKADRAVRDRKLAKQANATQRQRPFTAVIKCKDEPWMNSRCDFVTRGEALKFIRQFRQSYRGDISYVNIIYTGA